MSPLGRSQSSKNERKRKKISDSERLFSRSSVTSHLVRREGGEGRGREGGRGREREGRREGKGERGKEGGEGREREGGRGREREGRREGKGERGKEGGEGEGKRERGKEGGEGRGREGGRGSEGRREGGMEREDNLRDEGRAFMDSS